MNLLKLNWIKTKLVSIIENLNYLRFGLKSLKCKIIWIHDSVINDFVDF